MPTDPAGGGSPGPASSPIVIVAARNEAERVGITLEGIAGALPEATV